MEQFPLRLARPAVSRTPPRTRTATLVPGLKVGCQAAGSSGAQGSASGSPSGQLLPNGSGSLDDPKVGVIFIG
ncbi:hypothetical protein NDU88_005065 [Pleurodeles waltl]|uniref:Uncharacterized protein n=1 Tax=Pleurodeles waltl TaxID=8319 RepID=A0AAV7MA51_PLEWA|nr:hypothetical protein NDU88_005065 [Pleurodeles waltl]